MRFGIKAGVDLSNISPQMAIAHTITAEVMREHGRGCRITSGRDGEHKHITHPLGQALDFGIRNLTEEDSKVLAQDLQAALKDQYDVVLEWDKAHIHVEFDPR